MGLAGQSTLSSHHRRCPHITGPDLVSHRSRARTEIPMADPMPLAAPPGLSGHDAKQHFLQVFLHSVSSNLLQTRGPKEPPQRKSCYICAGHKETSALGKTLKTANDTTLIFSEPLIGLYGLINSSKIKLVKRVFDIGTVSVNWETFSVNSNSKDNVTAATECVSTVPLCSLAHS